jgi:hypothetical protein
METNILSDESVRPTDELVFSIIGERDLLWKQTMSYLHDNNKDISGIWKYYKDGKSWLFRAMKKKKTIFWIRLVDDTFRIAFWFAEKLEPIISQSDLPDRLKKDYEQAKSFNKSRCIFIDMQDSADLQNVKKLIDLKIKY